MVFSKKIFQFFYQDFASKEKLIKKLIKILHPKKN
tara:strand:+ start:218 stop:322 length:105 start_codon:yes stop_codon:yes gene_type:complete